MPEPEIHARLCRELGAITNDDIAPLREVAESGDRAAFADALFTAVAEKPELNGQLPVLLYETLGATFDDGGAMPSWLVEHGDILYLYYIGWTAGVTVSYRNSIGLAISDDGGRR